MWQTCNKVTALLHIFSEISIITTKDLNALRTEFVISLYAIQNKKLIVYLLLATKPIIAQHWKFLENSTIGLWIKKLSQIFYQKKYYIRKKNYKDEFPKARITLLSCLDRLYSLCQLQLCNFVNFYNIWQLRTTLRFFGNCLLLFIKKIVFLLIILYILCVAIPLFE